MKNDIMNRAMGIIRTADVLRNDGKGNTYVYEEDLGIFMPAKPLQAQQTIEKLLLKQEVNLSRKELKDLQRDVAERLEFVDRRLARNIESTWVACRNGLVDLKTGKLHPFNRDQLLKINLDFRYDENARLIPNSLWFRFLKTLLGEEERLEESEKLTELSEIIGYVISNLSNAKKGFIFLGPPSIGKSLLLTLVGRLLGEGNFTALNWRNLVDKYYTSLLLGKSAVLSDEMPTKPLRHLEVLKSVISGNNITAESKFGAVQDFKPSVKLLAASNSLPSLGEPDPEGAFVDRIHILALGKKSASKKDPHLLEQLWDERDIFFSLALKATAGLIERNFAFTEDPEGQALCHQLRVAGNPLKMFLQAGYQDAPDGKFCAQDLYADYQRFCEDSLLRPIQNEDFRAQLVQLGYSFKKKRVKGYPNPRSCVIGLIPKKEDEACQQEDKSPLSSEQSGKKS